MTSEIVMSATVANDETKNRENTLRTRIRSLHRGQVVWINTISNETHPNTGDADTPPMLRMRRASSTYGLGSFAITSGRYLVTGQNYSYDDDGDEGEIQSVVMCPLKENDLCVVDPHRPDLVTINGVLHIITFVLALDGTFRDASRGESMFVHVTDLQ